jgi:hypothetical protein
VEGPHSLLVLDDLNLLGHRVFLNEPFDFFEVLVGGGVVDDDHFVVGVVLVDDGAEIVFVPKILDIVDGGHTDAKGFLGQRKVIGLRKSLVLAAQYLVNFATQTNIQMTSFIIIQSEQE